ncbi:E3 ubiquitin-protein ligase UPL7 [Humulus lupulus]|uniref:E3 ubiquitin-protein ligase UPL7 n=1 Tax=Humulus lupulus TaxID=3486 RepID=UPI002B406C28|nr:E3 ubiquitin-protein ligase UPL7 [Humulus lupulus]XP_062117451.1 E3 ubiquitin-protein ligase UPL7 [Humulus lupulus]XP_062117452.1 E3 ubiquitin-protein ligase UPL7 [Humulus lupulus]XP_062117453.1 E3 ubiquitin-protein ligase UPL7 [Humulus lupulus]
MDEPRKHQVSLRGASAKEITRDALLQKVSQERELRHYAKRATAAAIFVQRVWRRYIVTLKVALQLQEEWEKNYVDYHVGSLTCIQISCGVLRPFLFFITYLSTPHKGIQTREINCMHRCFKILLESVNSSDPKQNFCSLATGTPEERRIWNSESRKLISLCLFILSEFDKFCVRDQEIVAVASLAMRLVIHLTDLKGWKNITNDNFQDADRAVKDLGQFMGAGESGLYISVRRYITTLDTPFSSQIENGVQKDDKFLITASAITLALRPLHVTNSKVDGSGLSAVDSSAEKYCVFLLTIPWLVQRLPAVLVGAMKHISVLSPCLRILLILKENILNQISVINQSKVPFCPKVIPPVGWALASIICLTTAGENGSLDSGWHNQGLDYVLYVRAVIILAEDMLARLENVRSIKNVNQEIPSNSEDSVMPTDANFGKSEARHGSLIVSYMDLFKPVCQQQHLMDLLAVVGKDGCAQGLETSSHNDLLFQKLGFLDVAYFYSYLLRIFSFLNPAVGQLYILNMLSFTPGFLAGLWGALESSLFPVDGPIAENHDLSSSKTSRNKKDGLFERRQKHGSKDETNKWVTVLHKFTGKSQLGADSTNLVDDSSSHSHSDEGPHDEWDVEPLKHGPEGISEDISCLLHLFCATYSHLLLILDDIEFYEKQVPFRIEQQRRIASMLNTFVYNGLTHSMGQQTRSLMNSAIKCLHSMYERDCRHQFCPPVLWLSPAFKSRPPIAVAARTHEVLSANVRIDDASTLPSTRSIITTVPHVYPFEERVEMFREFIEMDKASRKMAGEVDGPASRSVGIVVRRGHIVEDGFRQLNSLGPRLKSSIHVSFVSESGLPEAGLDYGGLSKEFLTDISKAAFAPEYGLFSQTSTSDRLLIPNASAKYLENGVQMIEFLGRVVGKALYEGILLDYSFSLVFVQKLLGRYSFLDELSTLDPELYRNLMYVKHYDNDVKDLFLDFTVIEESFGKQHVIELKPGGKDISVTNENKMQYIHAMADYKLNRQILPFSNAFYRGLTDLISPFWLKLFNAREFNQLLSGGDYDIDIDDLRRNTRYTGCYSEGSRTIKIFWEVLKGFEPNDRCMLLKFVTSCSRPPLLGFKHLQPTFTIHKVVCNVPIWATIGGQDVDRLPSASTCYNTLKLPTYKRASTLREKLLYAINSNAGFELS